MNPYSFDYYQKDGVRQLGQLFGELYKTNPFFIAQDQIFGFWFDQWIDSMLKSYYWPALMAGMSDNIVDLFKPQTYSICKA